MSEQIKEDFLGRYNVKLSTKHFIERQLLENGTWEEHVLQYINFFVHPGDCCLDIGANCGFHSIALADRTGPSGRVHAFEPNSITFPRLVDNVNLNPSLVPIIKYHKIGISDSDRILKVYQGGELGNAYVSDSFKTNLWNSGTADDFELCIVKTLDGVLHNTRVDFMKVDVEGMEINVFRGATQILERYRPHIIYETLVDSFAGGPIQDCERFLRSYGYHLFAIDLERFKLTPVTYPGFQEDTFAIHREKLIDAAAVLLNASKYTVTAGESAEVLELIITAAEDDIPAIKLETANETFKSFGIRRGQDFSFQLGSTNDGNELRLQFTNDFRAVTGHWQSGTNRRALSGVLNGGNFR
jgi:FkbM family methyltransferase